MSRVAKKIIELPKGVDFKTTDDGFVVKGTKGELTFPRSEGIDVAIEDGTLTVSWEKDSQIPMAGTTRAILANMIEGVSKGFSRKLELHGVGYRAQAQGKKLNLTLGFSHPVEFEAPEGITLETPSQTEVVVSGSDKQVVGQVAAKIRGFRPPEPYKGKGVRYAGERIIMKEAKKA